jgi:transcriptional regulator with XRE-family HTH domain
MTEADVMAPPHAAQGARIRAARKALGLTERALVDALGHGAASVVALGRWERGEREPRFTIRPRLAEVLRAPFHVLFVPEETATKLNREPRRLLLTAHGLPGSSGHLYIEVEGRGANRTNAIHLNAYWLVDDTGYDPKRRRHLWHVTGPGEDVLEVLRRD